MKEEKKKALHRIKPGSTGNGRVTPKGPEENTAATAYQGKKWCQPKLPIGKGFSKLPITLGKAYWERKENCCFSGLKSKSSYQSFSVMISYQKMSVGLE